MYIYIYTHTRIYTHFLKPIICVYTYHMCVCICTQWNIHNVYIYTMEYIYIYFRLFSIIG